MSESITQSEQHKILSVSEYIDFLNSGLKEYSAKIIGEVSKADDRGHVYFTLRDEADQSVINCIIWKSRYELFGIKLQEGVKIIATGRPNVYGPTGRLSFVADTIELAGEGALKKEYERLKKKLEEEGIFNPERKRPLPKFPQKIGLITSRSGAVLGDFLSNIGKFGFKIKMIDSRVEGQEAAEDLLQAVKSFKKQDIELLAIIRGGGSKESLEVFNNEQLVREVAAFFVPVIVAIGHHRDEPLIDFAADVSVSTPSIVATEISRSWRELLLFLERSEHQILGRYGEILAEYKNIENKFFVSVQNFKNILLNVKIDLRNFRDKSFLGFNQLASDARQKLALSEKSIALNNPERQLKLGYSIASVNGKVIRKITDVNIGADMSIKVSNGVIDSKVKQVFPNS